MLPWQWLTPAVSSAFAHHQWEKADVATAEEAHHIVADLQAARYTVTEVKKTTRSA